MRRCLHPSRLFRTGCGPINPRFRARFHPVLPRTQTRLSSTRRFIDEQEYDLLKSFHDPPTLRLSRLREAPIEHWVEEMLENVPPFPGPPTSSPPSSLFDHQFQLDRTFRLTEYMSLAKAYFEKDLLKHLAFNQKEWPTVYRILSSLIDTCEVLQPYVTDEKITSNLHLGGAGVSLAEFTSKSVKPDTNFQPIPPSSLISFHDLTNQPAARALTNRLKAEIFVNLGMLVLEAADQSAAESQAAMSCVHRILARLHHLGLVSDRVYQFTPRDPSQLAIRPPGIQLLSSTIMGILSDAAWVEHEVQLTSAAKEAGEEPLYLPFRVGCRQLGPEIWIEFILWCCIEHGHTKQGISLIEQMQKRNGSLAWKFESWTPLLKNLDVVQQTNINTEQFWRRPDRRVPRPLRDYNKLPFNGLGERTISLEIVTCLRSGLANAAYNGVGFHGLLPSDILTRARPLNAILEPSRSADDLQPTHRTSNWYIIRFLESGCLVPDNDPAAFEEFLRATRNVVPPWEENLESLAQLDNCTRAQLYDGTAAFLGLVEHSARAYTTRKSSLRAFFQYAWLQNIVDASKHNHVRAFFQHLAHSGPGDVPFFDSGLYESSPTQNSSLHLVSKVTLTRLLDLAITSRTPEFGEWLLFNTDIDGPSIPPSDYGNQVLSPAILRYAAMTQNQELARKVFSSLKTPLNVNVLKAIANYQITMQLWDNAGLTLNYLRDFRLLSWGHSNLATLGAKIIRLSSSIDRKVSNGIEVSEEERNHLDRARDLFFRFFDGEYNVPTSKNPRGADFQRRTLQRMRDVFLTIPGELSRLAREVTFAHPIHPPRKLQYLPANSFQLLLSAVVDEYDSKAGQQLWIRWVNDSPLLAAFFTKEGGVERLKARGERDFTSGNPNFDKVQFKKGQQKAVMPSIDLLRTIGQAAMREFYGEPSAVDPMPNSPDSSNPPEFVDPCKIPFSESMGRTYKLRLPVQLYKFQTAAGGLPPVSPSEAVLDFCVALMFRSGLHEHQISLEIPHHIERLRARGILTKQDKESRMRDRDSRGDPWMESHAYKRWRVSDD